MVICGFGMNGVEFYSQFSMHYVYDLSVPIIIYYNNIS